MKVTSNNLVNATIVLILGLLLWRLKDVVFPKSEFDQDSDYDVDEGNATLSNGDAGALADMLHEAMYSWGTDEETIKSVLIDLESNTDNFRKVYNAFGRRKYFDTGAPLPIFSWLATPENLGGWIKAEFDSASEEYLLFKNLCRKAGIGF